MRAEVSDLNIYVSKINNTEKDDLRFEDFEYERPEAARIGALFAVIEACMRVKQSDVCPTAAFGARGYA